MLLSEMAVACGAIAFDEAARFALVMCAELAMCIATASRMCGLPVVRGWSTLVSYFFSRSAMGR